MYTQFIEFWAFALLNVWGKVLWNYPATLRYYSKFLTTYNFGDLQLFHFLTCSVFVIVVQSETMNRAKIRSSILQIQFGKCAINIATYKEYLLRLKSRKVFHLTLISLIFKTQRAYNLFPHVPSEFKWSKRKFVSLKNPHIGNIISLPSVSLSFWIKRGDFKSAVRGRFGKYSCIPFDGTPATY